MKRIIILILLLIQSSFIFASEEIYLEKAPIDLTDQPSLQKGARTFINYCLNCHSAKYMRYNKLLDIGLSKKDIKDNLLFTGKKIGDPMEISMPVNESKKWFGAAPPDLSVVARSRGADWIYSYMKGFYRDSSREIGWNNIVYVNSAMPHILWELQGEQELDKKTASQIAEIFTEVIIAPKISIEAKEILSSKKNLRILVTGGLSEPNLPGVVIRSVSGGFLAQTKDNIILDEGSLRAVTKREPSKQEMQDLLFAFKVAKHVKSNAIVYAKDGATVGIGAGQMNRLDSSRIAARKSEDAAIAAGIERPMAEGSVVASDAFFPFADGLMAAADAGATAIIQPGGSIRDDEVIAAADDAGLAMLFTGVRHFNH